MKAAFHTLGCKVNQYETEAIKEAFVSRGAEVVSENEAADIYVVNTCTVTGIADRKSRQFIRRARKMNPEAIVVATGCYVQVAPEEIEKMPEIDFIVGNDLKSEIAERAIYAFDVKQGRLCPNSDEFEVRDDSMTFENAMSHVLHSKQLNEYEDMGIVTSDESSMCRAYIKIEDGCDRFCSYCLIPYARGRVRSRAPESIEEEARILIDKGYKEIVLTGINTALYGREEDFRFERMKDEEGMSGLEVIIKRLDAMDGDFRIRLSSLEPTVVDASDVKKLLGYGKLCHHLHLSIQSGSDKVLRAMNRRYNRAEYLEIVNAVREFDPLYGITTDIIVGFPGETDEDFADSLDIVRRAEFAKVHAFRYSPRKGTKGATLADKLPEDVKTSRSAQIEKTAEEAARIFNQKNLGIPMRVLTEEEKDGFITGYTDNYIKVYICTGSSNAKTAPRLGDFCRVILIENYRDGCRAVMA